MQPQTNLGPGAAASQMAGVTLTTMILIGIGVILAVLVIWWGAKKRRQRVAAERELVESGGVRDDNSSVAEADVTPVPPAAAVAPPPPSPAIEPVVAAPVAPALPPLEPEPTPTVATPPRPVAEPEVTRAQAASISSGDDLTQMKGVGPKLATRLNELGVRRYADIAALDPAAAEALDAQLGSFRGRLIRDRWIEQARFLAAGDRAGFEAAFGRL